MTPKTEEDAWTVDCRLWRVEGAQPTRNRGGNLSIITTLNSPLSTVYGRNWGKRNIGRHISAGTVASFNSANGSLACHTDIVSSYGCRSPPFSPPISVDENGDPAAAGVDEGTLSNRYPLSSPFSFTEPCLCCSHLPFDSTVEPAP